MKRPTIGMNAKYVRQDGSVYYRLDSNYVESVRRAGGEPLILPVFRRREDVARWLDRLDGLMMTGGADVHPRRWGEARHPKADLLVPEKERSDFWLLEQAERRGLPMLAICLGSQEANVARGAQVEQHLADLAPVNAAHRKGEGRHPVHIEEGTLLHDVLGRRRAPVNSFHHQAIRAPGRGMRLTARADDGVIEGTEDPTRRFWLAVQWHPERMARTDPVQRRLFSALVAASR